jgi:tRNA(Arg) A34 adenosine deaminase TadA
MSKSPASSRQHLSAVIYDKKGKVLSVGFNSYVKTHPMQAHHAKVVGQEHKIFMHAEIHAISRCKALKQAHKIVVSRWNKKGEPMYARPCVICQSAIEAAGIMVIEHT